MALAEMNEEELIQRLGPVFQPYAARKIAEARNTGQRFVHYTSCDAAISIIENNSMWLRNATLMNDFSEIQHGLGCLRAYWQTERGETLRQAIAAINPQGVDALVTAFDSNVFNLLNNTFLISVSEHDPSEDEFGRLSMWRAYGQRTGAALVFNNGPILSPTNAISAVSIPVMYAFSEGFADHMDEIAAKLVDEGDLLREIEAAQLAHDGRSLISENMEQVFRHACVATKHPGFREEREWRVVYQPGLNPTQPDRIAPATCTLGGIPQNIHKLFFQNYPDEGFVGATLPEILSRVIIGPTAHPYVVFTRMFDALQAKGVDTNNLLINSHIPLRH
ncbi:DUF2971 domain-containing protein [Sphingomonas sp. HITSZ_GF]|uniref:DUF2971 domain-containing protein n=1 Tax=Sphingomonas sp. HITSZ_GF TaxID=3037247 RepID=UPI00240D8561|nr:DUF2971 domain-containing protein [Sphingomonas sp. HITSZ_GF]MDG2532477.1 DUF2971 domain-containing protein [Sphingomonas sp. HITSZ_GF]